MAAEKYEFNQHDRVIVNAAIKLIDKLTCAMVLSPAQRISVAKMQLFLSRLPRVTDDLELTVSVTAPRNYFGEIETRQYWTISVEEGQLNISGSGHFYRPSTGGDSFPSFRWAIASGMESEFIDYTERLSIVPDIEPFEVFVEQIDFADPGYEVEIEDQENSFLDEDDDEEEEEEEEEEEPATPPLLVMPTDEFERKLASNINARDVSSRDAEFAYGIKSCHLCGCSLEAKGLFVDGSLRTNKGTANMCAKCFYQDGKGLGWGVGQLYARQASGSWRLVYGFRTGKEFIELATDPVPVKNVPIEADQAWRQLAADFGEDFTQMLSRVIDSRVSVALSRSREGGKSCVSPLTSGLTGDAALAALKADFGDQFAQMLCAVIDGRISATSLDR